MSETTQKSRSVLGRVLFGISATWMQTVAAVLINLVQLPLLYHYLARDALGALASSRRRLRRTAALQSVLRSHPTISSERKSDR